jgi:hypothetical protein
MDLLNTSSTLASLKLAFDTGLDRLTDKLQDLQFISGGTNYRFKVVGRDGPVLLFDISLRGGYGSHQASFSFDVENNQFSIVFDEDVRGSLTFTELRALLDSIESTVRGAAKEV